MSTLGVLELPRCFWVIDPLDAYLLDSPGPSEDHFQAPATAGLADPPQEAPRIGWRR